MRISILILLTGLFCLSCSDSKEDLGKLNLSMTFDKTLPRLGNFGQEVVVNPANAAQSPEVHSSSVHYIELAKDSLTLLGSGSIVYQGEETSKGGSEAIDFKTAIVATDAEIFHTINLDELEPGEYNWIRVSLSYQNYDIDFRYNDQPLITDLDLKTRVSSFVGFNTYIEDMVVKDSIIQVNSNKLQGFWAFETSVEFAGQNFGFVSQGDGAGVTVVNPLNQTSPVPVGSCIVTGKLAQPLLITGDETEDKLVVLAFSVNNSFEWKEVNFDGKFEPAIGESVVDMGLRGLHPYVQ